MFCICFICIIFSAESYAQRRNSIYGEKNITSFLGGHIWSGYSNFYHNIEGVDALGGGAIGLGVDYLLRYKRYFNFNVGIETMLLNSNNRFDEVLCDAKYYYNDPSHVDLPLDYHIKFYDCFEQDYQWGMAVPIMVGVQTDGFYCLFGGKVKYVLKGFYKTNSKLVTVVDDPEFIESLEEILTHNIGHYDAVSQGVNFYNLDVLVSAEIGVILNALMPGYNKGGSRRYNKGTYCRLGLFADYGCLNINGNSFDEPMIKFPGMVDMGNGEYSVPAVSVHNVGLNSILASDLAKDSYLNSLVLGVKFTILFQLGKKDLCRCH
jgi:hypothetical protein